MKKLLTQFKIFFFAVITLTVVTNSSEAQFVDFGRNKVHYADFKWHTLETEHFVIYYYEGAKELAEQGAYYAEEVYSEHMHNFKHSLTHKVPMIFYSSPIHFKQTNTTPGFIPDGVGGFFEFVKGRVVIPFEGSLGQFKHVIRHELVHVFMMSKLISEQKLHGQVGDKDIPLWFTEGLAELWSTDWDTQSEMSLKDAVLNDYIVGLDDWEKLYGSYLMYKMGQKVLEYIEDKYGPEKILQLLENFYMDGNFSEVMKVTIGKDYEEFDKEFLPYLRNMYLADSSITDNPSDASIDIYSKGFAHKPVYTVIDGKEKVYYIGNEYGYTSVFGLEPDKKNPEVLVEGEKSDEFEQFHFFRTGMDASKDGKLAFITQKGENDAIHIYDFKEEDKIADYSFDEIVNIGSPSWSSDGKKILFPAREFSGKGDLYILDTETEKLTRLTNDFYDDRDPDFSPDGNYVVFSSDRTSYGYKNRYNLFLYDLRTNEISYLTNGDQVDYSPQFSEDGRKIIFTSNATGPQNIWMIDLSNSLSSEDSLSEQIYQNEQVEYNNLENVQMRRLTSFNTAAYDPRWAGDDKIVFSSFEDRNIAIRMIDTITTTFENSLAVIDIDYSDRGENWTAGKIEGIPGRNTIEYEKDFSLDFATTSVSSDPVFGTNAGGIISLSDMLGNEKYYFLLFNNSDDDSEFWKSFNVAISKVSLEKRLNYAYGIFHLSGKRYDLAEADYSYYERLFGGYASFSYPLSVFRRLEASVSLAQSFKDIDITDKERSTLLTNRLSYIKDNALWGMTGPVDGERLNITLGYTTDIENSNVSYYSLLFDYRKYFRISRELTFATRGQYFMNEGKNPRRFFMGGTWSLRGWPRHTFKGTKLWQTNAELRFPIINLYDKDLPLGINYIVPGIRGALFFDVGNVWDNSSNYTETRGSIGASLKVNTFGFLILRYDVGKRIERNFTHLQDNFFHQVFFGWDF